MYECSVKSTFFLLHAISVFISHFAVVNLWLFLVHFDVCARSSENPAVSKMVYCIVVKLSYLLWNVYDNELLKSSFHFYWLCSYSKVFIQFAQADLLKMYFLLNIFSSIRRREIFLWDGHISHFQLEHLVRTLYLQKLLVPEGMLVINFSCLLCVFTFPLFQKYSSIKIFQCWNVSISLTVNQDLVAKKEKFEVKFQP